MEKHISEFVPVELIIVYDPNDIPDQHYELILKWLKKKYNYKGDLITDVWDIGYELRIIHWEWHHDSDYSIVIDISGYPDDKEQGIICIDDEIIFEHDKQKLTNYNKSDLKSGLTSKLKALEHIRKLNCKTHQHCKYCQDLYQELKDDLKEESVDEDEIKEYIAHYEHYSDDDASTIEESDDSESS
jgi:hypothetical protein